MIPDWKLERYLQGTLPHAEAEEIRIAESEDDVLHARLEALRQSDKEILARYPAERTVPKIREKASHKTKQAFWLYAPLAAAAVFLVFFIPLTTPGIASFWDGDADKVIYSESGTQIKGFSEARLEVWQKAPDSAQKLDEQSEVRAGDELQVRYAVPEKCYGLIFSIDGNGTMTAHLADGDAAVELAPGKMATLPFAYKLDNAPYFEKFFFVTSKKEFHINEKNLDSLLKDKEFQVKSLTLRKASEGGK